MKDRIKLKVVVAMTMVLCSISALVANPLSKNTWEYLGEKNIGHVYDKDVIYVDDYRALYTAIELRTDKKQIDLHRCVIYFENGDRQDVQLREDRRGSETHIIELNGGARAIDRIAIWGSRDYGKIFRAFDRGTVEIWGQAAKRRNRKNNETQYYSSRYSDYYRDNNRNWNDNRNNRYQNRRDDYRRDDNRRRDDRRRNDRRRDNQRRGSICP